MRKIPTALTVLALASLSLAGCSTADTDASCPTPADSGLDGTVTVSGSTSREPSVEMYTPLHVDETVTWDVGEGSGTPVTTDDQLVVVDITLVSGETGETLVATPYDGSLTNVFSLAQWEQTFPDFADIMHCAGEGSRIVAALPPEGVAEQTAAAVGLGADDSALAVVDVRKVYLPKADGEDQYVVGHGMPTVVRAPDGRPGVIVPDQAPPEDVVVEVLKKGDGEIVDGTAPVRVHYTGVTWADREVFDTSWDGDPASFTLDAVVPGFAQALEGQTVGSQVLAVVPPEAGYGDQAQGSIPAGSTLVFVVDILGVDAVPADE